MKKRIISVLLVAGLVSLPVGPMTQSALAAVAFGEDSNGMTSPTSGNASTSISIDKPDGTVGGDLLLAQITIEKGNSNGGAITPTGTSWTSVRRTNAINQMTGTDLGQEIFYRIATGSEPASYTWTLAESQKAAGGIIRYTGVNQIHPSGPIVTSSGNAGDSSTLTATGITVPANSMLVALYGFKKSGTTLSVPTNMTGRYLFQNPQDVTVRAADELRTASGATGDRVSSATVTSSGSSVSAKWIAQLVGIRGNTIPAYTAPSGQNGSEGTAQSFDLGSFVDPDAHGTWSITVDWGDGTTPETFSFASDQTTPFADRNLGTRAHTYDDNGNYTVSVTVNDGTDSTTGTFGIGVANLPPTASFGNSGPIDEGGSVTVAFTDPSDPSPIDTASGFRYAFDCGGVVANLPTTFAAAGTQAIASCPFDDNGTFTIAGRILDKDDGFGTYTTSATVDNVAPTATLGNDGPILEGGSATVTFTNQFDPSVADTDAGFHYGFACDGLLTSLPATYDVEAAGTDTTAECSFTDNGTFTVYGRIFDKDDGYTTYPTTVVVNNVPPTATLGNNGPIVEGGSDTSGPTSPPSGATVSFSNQFDPSASDTTAGFRYAFDCGGVTASLPTSYFADGTVTAPSQSCSFADNGSYTVVGRIFDKDDGFTDYSTTVTVTNAAPSVTSNGDQGPVVAGTSNDFDLGSFTDLGVNDGPWGVDVDWGDLGTSSLSTTIQGSLGLLSHTYASAGTYLVTVRVTDKDGDYGEATFFVTVDPAVVTTPTEITFEAACTGMTNAPKGDASKYLTICVPDGVEAGDLLLAQIGFEKGSDAGTDAQLTPAGWTLVRRTNSKTDIGEALYYRVATGSEPPSYTWPFKQAVKAAGGIIRYSGVDTTNPIVASSGNAGDSSKLTALSANAEADSMLVALYVFKKKDTTLLVPPTMTGRYNYQNPQDVTIRVAEELRESAGPTGDRVAYPSPVNSDKWAAQQVVLRAAP